MTARVYVSLPEGVCVYIERDLIDDYICGESAMYLHLKKQNKKQTIRSLCNMNCKYPWKYPCLFTLGVTCGWTIRPWGRPTGSALFQLQADHHSSRAHIPTLKWVFFHLGYTFHCARQYLNGSQATVDGIRFYWGKVMHDMKLYIYT